MMFQIYFKFKQSSLKLIILALDKTNGSYSGDLLQLSCPSSSVVYRALNVHNFYLFLQTTRSLLLGVITVKKNDSFSKVVFITAQVDGKLDA